jgi:hypothetical protein
MYNTSMSDKFNDKKGFSLFIQEKDGTKINLWTFFLIILFILFLSGISITVRDWIYSGAELAQWWYDGVDDILDALGAPKLP